MVDFRRVFDGSGPTRTCHDSPLPDFTQSTRGARRAKALVLGMLLKADVLRAGVKEVTL